MLHTCMLRTYMLHYTTQMYMYIHMHVHVCTYMRTYMVHMHVRMYIYEDIHGKEIGLLWGMEREVVVV